MFAKPDHLRASIGMRCQELARLREPSFGVFTGAEPRTNSRASHTGDCHYVARHRKLCENCECPIEGPSGFDVFTREHSSLTERKLRARRGLRIPSMCSRERALDQLDVTHERSAPGV